jgi:hypothetical protein
MARPERIEPALQQAGDFESFAQGLLGGALGWPIPEEAARPVEVGYEWSTAEVGADRTSHKAQAFELMLLPRGQQPHGIFLLEFHDERVFDTHGFATPLRAVLRRLVASQRKEGYLPSWKLDNILFICTHDYTQYAFAMFRDTFGTGKVADAKLATFGWSKDQPCRTVITENLPNLSWPEDTEDKPAWVKAWAAAFDKEPLTKRFFVQFDEALKAIKTDLEKLGKPKPKSADAYSKAQLLLERLIFLYFVQNRGWLNQNSGFLLKGFEPYRKKPKECSYYEEFLEPLFWSLSSPGHPTFDRLDYVPFLNGGLFNDDEFEPSPRRRKDNPALPIRNETFATVFDEFLEAFNFTVREDTPLNQEVAVDPEMLGKVFESIVLHAESADPDATAPDKRKETGSFYTPRIVVHFNCREVLYQWLLPRLTGDDWPQRLRRLLDIDASDDISPDEMEVLKSCLLPEEGTRLLELVKALRCCDPAVGSGAFMVGLLHELTNLRRLAQAAANGYVDPLRQQGSKWLHKTKADIIRNCLFGVDIQQQAVEICMLRLWLSLVVDYDIGLNPFTADKGAFKKALADISQLPNLEMNFKRGDSLHDHICGEPVVLNVGFSRQFQKEIARIQEAALRLHGETSSVKKTRLRLDIARRRMELSDRVLTDTLMLLKRKDWLETQMLDESMRPLAKSKAELDVRMHHLRDAIDRLAADVVELGRIEKAYEKEREAGHRSFTDRKYLLALRKLEGASFDAPFNFAWRIDFPQVFYPEGPKATFNGRLALGNELKGQMDLAVPTPSVGGFDIFVGNPPFVTARNREKRELYRERWQQICHQKYLLLVPFFPLGFGLLKKGGELGFIVSNAFAKRTFGQPLVEQFFPTIDLQKVIDCSGLMFPGHGTPTCLVFGANRRPDPEAQIRVAAILPGGGDLRTPPEESALWHTLSQHHDEAGFGSQQVVVADRTRRDMGKWPWNLDSGAEPARGLLEAGAETLSAFIEGQVGPATITRSDEVFIQPVHTLRRARIETTQLRSLAAGDSVRNWSVVDTETVIFPYRSDYAHLSLSSTPRLKGFLAHFRAYLENVIIFDKPKKDTDIPWWEYTDPYPDKNSPPLFLGFPEIVTHAHFLFNAKPVIFPRTSPVVRLPKSATSESHHLLAALLNSPSALFWLKQVCFSKRESEHPEKDTYYVLAGGKVEQLPVPNKVAKALKGEWNPLAKRLAEMAQECWERGQKLPTLAMKKVFEKPGEAYHEWNSSLPGYEKPHPTIGKPFGSAKELKQTYDRVVAERERLRAEMIALQEEMDWLVYAAYGFLPDNHAAAQVPAALEPLDKELRPYRLWQAAKGDFAAASDLISSEWSDSRKRLWRERLAAIRDNEHIRRIEQPVYKRRWDEQWKVKNRWECGPAAYEQELADAFDWWLLEKAEWYLEHKKDGGPAELSAWAQGLWRDTRIQAAVEVVHPSLAGPEGFMRLLKEKVEGESVPDGIPFAKPWEELEKKHAQAELNKARKIRGKLNVPRERFHLVSKGFYKWAGMMFR